MAIKFESPGASPQRKKELQKGLEKAGDRVQAAEVLYGPILKERRDRVPVEEVGVAIYGKFWVSGLARDLGVSVQSIRNWSAIGHVPENREQALRQLVRDRIGSLQALLEGK